MSGIPPQFPVARSNGKGYLFAYISPENSGTFEIITVPAVHHLGLRKYPQRLCALSSDMAATPHYTHPTRNHGGSSKDDVLNEPDWAMTHRHRIGFRDRDDRRPAYTHTGDDWDLEQEREFLAQAKQESEELNKKLGEHDLISVRDYMDKQEVRSSVSQTVIGPDL